MHQPLVRQRIHSDVHLVLFQEGGRVTRPYRRGGTGHDYVVCLHHLALPRVALHVVAAHVVVALAHGVIGAQVNSAAHVDGAVSHALLLQVPHSHRHVQSRRLLDNHFGDDVARQRGVVEALGGLLILLVIEGNAGEGACYGGGATRAHVFVECCRAK